MVYAKLTLQHSFNVLYKEEEYTPRFGFLVTAMSDPFDKTILSGLGVYYDRYTKKMFINPGVFNYGKYIVETFKSIEFDLNKLKLSPDYSNDTDQDDDDASTTPPRNVFGPGMSFRFLPEEKTGDYVVVKSFSFNISNSKNSVYEFLLTDDYVSCDLLDADSPSIIIFPLSDKKIRIEGAVSIDVSQFPQSKIYDIYTIARDSNSSRDINHPLYKSGNLFEIEFVDQMPYVNFVVDRDGKLYLLPQNHYLTQVTLELSHKKFLRIFYRRGLYISDEGLQHLPDVVDVFKIYHQYHRNNIIISSESDDFVYFTYEQIDHKPYEDTFSYIPYTTEQSASVIKFNHHFSIKFDYIPDCDFEDHASFVEDNNEVTGEFKSSICTYSYIYSSNYAIPHVTNIIKVSSSINFVNDVFSYEKYRDVRIQRYYRWIELVSSKPIKGDAVLNVNINHQETKQSLFDESYFGISITYNFGYHWLYINAINNQFDVRFVGFDPVLSSPIDPYLLEQIYTYGRSLKLEDTVVNDVDTVNFSETDSNVTDEYTIDEDNSTFNIRTYIDVHSEATLIATTEQKSDSKILRVEGDTAYISPNEFINRSYEKFVVDFFKEDYQNIVDIIQQLQQNPVLSDVLNSTIIYDELLSGYLISKSSVKKKAAITFQYFHESSTIVFYIKDIIDITENDCIIGLLVTSDGYSFDIEYRDSVHQRMIPYAEWCDSLPEMIKFDTTIISDENNELDSDLAGLTSLDNLSVISDDPNSTEDSKSLPQKYDLQNTVIAKQNNSYDFLDLEYKFMSETYFSMIKEYCDSKVQLEMLRFDFDLVDIHNITPANIEKKNVSTDGMIYRSIVYLEKYQYYEVIFPVDNNTTRYMVVPIFNNTTIDTDYWIFVNDELIEPQQEYLFDNKINNFLKIRIVSLVDQLFIYGLALLYDVEDSTSTLPMRVNHLRNKNVPYFDYVEVTTTRDYTTQDLLSEDTIEFSVSYSIHLDDITQKVNVSIYAYDTPIYSCNDLSVDQLKLTINTSEIRLVDFYFEKDKAKYYVPITVKLYSPYGNKEVDRGFYIYQVKNKSIFNILDISFMIDKILKDENNHEYYEGIVIISVDDKYVSRNSIYLMIYDDDTDELIVTLSHTKKKMIMFRDKIYKDQLKKYRIKGYYTNITDVTQPIFNTVASLSRYNLVYSLVDQQ